MDINALAGLPSRTVARLHDATRGSRLFPNLYPDLVSRGLIGADGCPTPVGRAAVAGMSDEERGYLIGYQAEPFTPAVWDDVHLWSKTVPAPWSQVTA